MRFHEALGCAAVIITVASTFFVKGSRVSKMRVARTEAKIFVSVFLTVFLSAFFGVFTVLPLYYNHPLFDFGRLRNVTSFLLFLVLLSSFTAGISAVSYKMHKKQLTRTEVEVFAVTFFMSFIAIWAILTLITFYWGHDISLTAPIDSRYSSWGWYNFSLYMLYFMFLSLVPAVFSVLIYGTYKLIRSFFVEKRRKQQIEEN